jgi:hypothetical protein
VSEDPKLILDKTLSVIEQIVTELPKVRSRREMKMISDRLLGLTESVRRRAQEMEREKLILQYEYPAKRFEREKGVKRGNLAISSPTMNIHLDIEFLFAS